MKFSLPSLAQAKRYLRPKFAIPAGVAALGLMSLAFLPNREDAAGGATLVQVESGTFTIALPAGGSLEAVDQVVVRNQVPGRTQIISLVREGTIVKQGDLLFELDSADIDNQLTQAEISYQQSLTNLAEQEERYEIQQSDNIIRLRDAELAVELAATDLGKYVEGEWPQQRKKAESAITLASEELRRAQDRLDGTRRLEERGYATASELMADELVVKRREIELQGATEEQRMLIEFDYPRSLRQLEANLENATIRLERIERQNDMQIEKSEMQLASTRETVDLRLAKLEELRQARDFTKVYAPQDGLVVYHKAANWRQEPVEEGSTVRERQEMIILPDVSQMKVVVNIYENQVSLVKRGMRAFVKLDALPDQRFRGEVISIASMPEAARDGNPNYRVYKAEVLVLDPLPEIKPGITARVDVLIAELEDVIKVPIQSVIGVEDRQFCFVQRGGRLVPVQVEVGLFDNDFVEIRSGLEVGDMVSLAPPRHADLPARDEEAPLDDEGEEIALLTEATR